VPLELLEVTCKKVEYIKVPLELNFAANGMPHPADSVGMHEGVSLLPNVPGVVGRLVEPWAEKNALPAT
jgi:hypothetical protein